MGVSKPKKKPIEKFEFQPIGYLSTCFKEKFGIPRQSGLVNQATGFMKLPPGPAYKNSVRALEQFSHVWLVFVFHNHGGNSWKPSIRPPRLGGVKKVGVLASRSPHRPNPIGISVVKLDHVDADAKGGPEIHVSGVDLLDGTPILDLKPYIPYADSIPDANPGWAHEPIVRTPVIFSEQAEAAIADRARNVAHKNLKALIHEILELDPRPAFQQRTLSPRSETAQGTRYGFRLFYYDVLYEIQDENFVVIDVIDVPNE